MTLLAVKPQVPQPDIGSILDVLAQRQPVEFDCASSPVSSDCFEVDTRGELEERLEKLFPFRPQLAPVNSVWRAGVRLSLIDGPPIVGDGDSMRAALDEFLSNALSYVEEWEASLRFGANHQRYWGWVYRILLAGDDEHILATLLGRAVE